MSYRLVLVDAVWWTLMVGVDYFFPHVVVPVTAVFMVAIFFLRTGVEYARRP